MLHSEKPSTLVIMSLLLGIFFLISASACSLFHPGQNYYLRPTIADRAAQKSVILNGEILIDPEHGTPIKKDKSDFKITDIDVFTFMNDVKQSWRDRAQTSRVSGLTGGVSTVGLAAAATTAAATHGGTTAGNTVPILTGIGTFIQSLFGLFDPAGRDVAYEDGIRILLAAESEYCQTQVQKTGNCYVDGKNMTPAGATLLDRTNAAIDAVDKALEGRIPTKDQLERATAKTKEEIQNAVQETETSVAVSTTSAVLSPGSSQTIAILHGKQLIVSSEDDRVATVKETAGSNGQKYDISAVAGGDCKATKITFSTSAKPFETKSVPVRVESVQAFTITAPSDIKVYKTILLTPHVLTIAGCGLKTVKSNDTDKVLAKLVDDHTISVETKNLGDASIELTNVFDRSAKIQVVVSPPPVVPYSNQKSQEAAKELQNWLNSYYATAHFEKLKVDGVPGDNTSDAYKLVTGQPLPGDKRP